MPPHRPSSLCGVVFSAGKMMKAVKVRIAKQTYNSFIRKVRLSLDPPFPSISFSHYPPSSPLKPLRKNKLTLTSPGNQHFRTYQSHLVSDPTSSLRAGDVVRIAAGWHTSRRIKHVVTEILAPYGSAIDERPALLTEEQRLEKRRVKREAKLERRRMRREEAGLQGESDEGERSDGRGEGRVPGKRAQHNVDLEGAGKRGRQALKMDREAGRVQEGLDEEGVGADEVRRRLEGIKV